LRSQAKEADERLLIEAAQKDPARFVDLYEDNFERVYAFVSRRVHSRADAEDVTAEVFHQAFANIAKFEWRGAPFAAWLYRIAANAIADRWQRVSREQGSPLSGDPADPSEAVDVEKSERTARLFNLVEGLPEDQRRVIGMRFAEEKSIREIAQTLGRTPGAVKQLQFRGIQTLRAQFEKEPGKKLSRSHG
jgi:RNA polymerase sigma-70 factor (ECF subfamily)